MLSYIFTSLKIQDEFMKKKLGISFISIFILSTFYSVVFADMIEA